MQKIFWGKNEQVIHNRASNQAVAVVGVNNPHLDSAPAEEDMLCPNLQDKKNFFVYFLKKKASCYLVEKTLLAFP